MTQQETTELGAVFSNRKQSAHDANLEQIHSLSATTGSEKDGLTLREERLREAALSHTPRLLWMLVPFSTRRLQPGV